jgi:hypothetical protein
MRADMHKVVVERERGGSSRRNRKWGKRLCFVPESDYDDQPKFASSARRRQYGYNSKWFTDVLTPLEGFLRSNLGRPWDKVYSELRQGLDVRKVTGRHIFDHLESMVATDCWIGADRDVYARPRGYAVLGFYVHPRTGLLCFAPKQSARQRKKERLLRQEIDEIRLDRSRSYKLLDGQWYFVIYEIVEIGYREETRKAWDVVQRQQVQLIRGWNRVAVSKRQCNHAEGQIIAARIAEWKKEVRRM